MSPSWETNHSSGTLEKKLRILLNPNFSLPLVSILSQMSPVEVFPFYSFKIHFNIIVYSTQPLPPLSSSKRSLSISLRHQTCMYFSSPPCVPHAPSIQSSFISSTECYLVRIRIMSSWQSSFLLSPLTSCRLGHHRPPIRPNTRVLQTGNQGRRQQSRKSIIFRFVRNGGITPLILNLGIRWEGSGQIHAPVALPAGRESLNQLNVGLGAPLGRPGPFEEDKSLWPFEVEVFNFGSLNSPRIRTARHGEKHLVRESVARLGGAWFRETKATHREVPAQ